MQPTTFHLRPIVVAPMGQVRGSFYLLNSLTDRLIVGNNHAGDHIRSAAGFDSRVTSCCCFLTDILFSCSDATVRDPLCVCKATIRRWMFIFLFFRICLETERKALFRLLNFIADTLYFRCFIRSRIVSALRAYLCIFEVPSYNLQLTRFRCSMARLITKAKG